MTVRRVAAGSTNQEETECRCDLSEGGVARVGNEAIEKKKLKPMSNNDTRDKLV